MPPQGKSKAGIAQKQSYLGIFTKSARGLDKMKIKIKISEQKKHIKEMFTKWRKELYNTNENILRQIKIIEPPRKQTKEIDKQTMNHIIN